MKYKQIIQDPLGFKGKVFFQPIRSGIDIKIENLSKLHQTRVETHFEPGVRLVFALEGLTDLRMGNNKIQFNSQTHLCAGWFSVQQDEFGFKHFQAQDNKRELVFFFSFAWLKQSLNAEQYAKAKIFFTSHLHVKHFVFTPLMQTLIAGLFVSKHKQLTKLQQESLYLLLIDEALSCICLEKKTNNERLLQAVNKLDALLKTGEGYNLSISDMAKLCHTNTSTLQRFFKQQYGIGIGAYRRKLQLQKAHQALEKGCSVMQAACLAEYTHLQSFSDAFRREFGYLPRQVKGQV